MLIVSMRKGDKLLTYPGILGCFVMVKAVGGSNEEEITGVDNDSDNDHVIVIFVILRHGIC